MEACDEVVDERQVIKDLAVAENDEAPASDAAKKLQQSTIARSVDAGRPRDDDLHAGLARSNSGDVFSFELCLLIDVTRPERRVLICWWMFDVTMDADGAAVHDALRTTGFGRLDDRANRRRIHRAVLLFAKAGLAVDGGDVIDDVDGLGRSLDRFRVR
jgi:hypothetical protein